MDRYFEVGDKVLIKDGKYEGEIGDIACTTNSDLFYHVKIDNVKPPVILTSTILELIEEDEPKSMMTEEMVVLAQANGKTYISDYGKHTESRMKYNKEKGFHDENGLKWKVSDFGMNKGLQTLLLDDTWVELRPKRMTKTDIEKELGYEIEIVEENEE